MANDAMPYGIGSTQWPGLAKLMEEMGELQQVLGKLMACDGPDAIYWDGTSLVPAMMEEVADVRAALEFFMAVNLTIDQRRDIFTRVNRKVGLFWRWHEKTRGEADGDLQG